MLDEAVHMLRHRFKPGGIQAMPGKQFQEQRRHRLLRPPQELGLLPAGFREENRRSRTLLEPTRHPVMIGMMVGEHNLFNVLQSNAPLVK